VRRRSLFPCVLLSLTVASLPLNREHAHVDATDGSTTAIHLDHSHDAAAGGEPATGGDDHIVQVSDHTRLAKFKWSDGADWLFLAFFAALIILLARFSTLVLLRRKGDSPPPSRELSWRPPLRGPPHFSIA